MVVDGEVFVPLDVLRVNVTFVLMEPDANHLPSGFGFHLGLEVHELPIGNAGLQLQDIFTERGKFPLALLPCLLGVEFLSLTDQGNDRFTICNCIRLEHHAVILGEVRIDVRRDFPFTSCVLQTVGLGGFNVC